MTYNLFISHSWAYGDAYDKLTDMLRAKPYFDYRDYSVPKDDPIHNAPLLLTTGFVQNYSGFFVRNQTGFLSARDFYLNFWRTFFYNSLRCTNA